MLVNTSDYRPGPLDGTGGGEDRYPRLQVDYGRLPHHVALAGDHDSQEDALLALLDVCWPNGRWVECIVIDDSSAGWLS